MIDRPSASRVTSQELAKPAAPRHSSSKDHTESSVRTSYVDRHPPSRPPEDQHIIASELDELDESRCRG